MNARQKAKKLKKELEELKADKANGFKWLKIDGLRIKREEPRLWYDNTPVILNYIPVTYEIRIGHTTVEIKLEDSEDRLIVIDSKKFDEAIRERERQGGDFIKLEYLYQSFKEQAKTFESRRNEAFISGNELQFAECSSNAIYFNELAGYIEELRLYRLHYDKAAERIQRKMKESNDFIVFNNKRYVSYSELCEILEEKDILKEGE